MATVAFEQAGAFFAEDSLILSKLPVAARLLSGPMLVFWDRRRPVVQWCLGGFRRLPVLLVLFVVNN